ncbi:MAG TPA: hypothetical protein VHD56_11370 [Tepidisphaeraceae bacterium]|nr:hypothetical protein [Tepidisphaeraceae bacterium]
MPDNSSLIILGIDAGDPELIQQFIAEGYLPAIRSIMERGWHARTGGPELFAEHGVWASIFSGQTRDQMGYYYFRQLKPGTYDIVPVSGMDITAPPFWKAMAGGNLKAAIIDVPDAYPVKGVPGAQLSNWAIHLGWVSNDPAFAPYAEPQSLLNEARIVFGERHLITENSKASVEQDKELFKQLLAQVEKKGKLCRHILAKDRYDLIFAVFHEAHTSAHQFWKYQSQAQGTNDARDDATLRNAIRDIYIAIDREFGRILAGAPANANVFIVGSVGLKDYYPTAGLAEKALRLLGYQHSPPPGKVSFKPMDLARRILPESVRIALSKRLSREARERIVAEQFRANIDWSRTTAFAIPTFYKTLIRINLRGREPQGIVEPGKEYLELLGRIEADFRSLIDPRTGKSAISDVQRAIDVFGKTPPAVLPDLLIEWKAPHFLERVVHPKGEIRQNKPEWYRPSDHTQHGFIAAAGPAFSERGVQNDVLIPDLAPTFLSLLNLPIPSDLQGRPLFSAR